MHYQAKRRLRERKISYFLFSLLLYLE